ncbi:hypothetical protein BGM19_23240 [Streptomyces agglomeratus]|nr:hypothetical protein BGM19_23240 [Streptomyces agglomeratus]
MSLSIPERRQRFQIIESQIHALVQDARDEMADGDRETEVRSITSKQKGLFTVRQQDSREDDSWRSLLPSGEEYRTLVAENAPGTGGYAVPDKVASEYVDHLRAASVLLRASINVHPFDGGSFMLPNLTGSGSSTVVAEGAAIPENSATFGPLAFEPIKYADLYKASNEILLMRPSP